MFEALDIQAWVHNWILQVPDWWAFIDDGTHGVLGILIGVAISVWALSLLYNSSTVES